MFKFFSSCCVILVSGISLLQSKKEADLIIKDVTIIQVAEGTLLSHQTVVIAKDRIIETGPLSIANNYQSKQTINATGKYIMPGLWDMHVHFGGDTLVDENEMLLPLYIAMGVTTVRDAAGDISNDVLKWRNMINDGKLVGPRIFTSGPKLEGKKSIWPGDLEIETQEELQQALDSLKKLKVDFVKITDNTLAPSLFIESIQQVRKIGWKVSGHSPVQFTLEELSNAGLSTIEHLSYVLRAASPEEAVIAKARAEGTLTAKEASERLLKTRDTTVAFHNYKKLAANGTAVVPTMIGSNIIAYINSNDHQNDTYLKYLGPELKRTYSWRVERAMKDDNNAIAFRQQQFEATATLLPILYKAGVTIIAGTDAGYLNSYVYPGLGLHQELAMMVKYGLSPQAVLKASVINGPAFFGLEHEYGSVSKNKKADLLLLNRNPLENITATQTIYAVIRNGTYMSRATLDQTLSTIEQWVKQKEEKEKQSALK
jgi:imidazolonepropionase-like amidohydrolase